MSRKNNGGRTQAADQETGEAGVTPVGDDFAGERRSLLRRIQLLEGEVYDMRIILRQALELRSNAAGHDISELHRAFSYAIRAGQSGWALTTITEAWLSGLDISPPSLEKMGIPVSPTRGTKQREGVEGARLHREEGWKEEGLRQAGERAAARKLIPLLVSLREGAFKASESLDVTINENAGKDPAEMLNDGHRRTMGIRRAIDCLLTIAEGLGEDRRDS